MVVLNKKKFVRAILIIVGIIIALNFIIMNKVFSSQEITYKKVSIIEGDTLWDIASREKKNNPYYEDDDVRDIISNIKQINDLESSNLKENQVLKIPTF